MEFNSPPGWPRPPAGWKPDPSWAPDPSWPPAPAGWRFWGDQPTSTLTDVEPPPAAAPPAAAPLTTAPIAPATPAAAPPGGKPSLVKPSPVKPSVDAPPVDAPRVLAPTPSTPPPGVLTCRFCGSFPALDGKSRGHRGMIIFMTQLEAEGAFCRSCGLEVTRRMSASTLLVGWWGIASFFWSWFVLAANMFLLRKLAALDPPQGGDPSERGEPGPGLFSRPQIWMLLIPIAVIAFFAYAFTQPTTSGG